MKGESRWASLAKDDHCLPSASLSSQRWRRARNENTAGKFSPSIGNTKIGRESAIHDGKMKKIIQSLKTEVASYCDEEDAARHGDTVIVSLLDALSMLICSESDHLCPLVQTSKQLSREQCRISNDLLWEAVESMMRILQRLISVPCYGLLGKISTITAACLQILRESVPNSINDSETNELIVRPRSMTNLKLCECSSIIADCISSVQFGLGVDELALRECKMSLITCLGIILSISTLIGMSDGTRRSPLFPWGAERTVNVVVKHSVLPFIEEILMPENSSMTTFDRLKYCFPAIYCLHILLEGLSLDSYSGNRQLSKHATAIFAPLIVDVNTDGKECEKNNPLRSRTLNAIVSFWGCSYQFTQNENSDTVSAALEYIKLSCQCMTTAVNTLYLLRQGKTNISDGSPPVEVDVATLCSQIQNMLSTEHIGPIHCSLLQLFSILCSVYQGPVAGQWHLFLEQSTPQLTSSYCATESKCPPLLQSFLENGTVALRKRDLTSNSTVVLPDVLHVVVVLISSMPFARWVGDDKISPTRLSGENYFALRVRKSALSVIQYTHGLMICIRDLINDPPSVRKEVNKMPRLFDSIVTQTSHLATQICTTLPFGGRNSVFLVPASKLVDCAAAIYVSCFKSLENAIASPDTPDVFTFYENAIAIFGRAILDCFDNNSSDTNIETQRTNESPAQHWIANGSSFEFLELLLSRRPTSFEHERITMVSCVARNYPQALVGEPINFLCFVELCSVTCDPRNEATRRLLGIKLVESFFVGKKMYLSEYVSLDMNNSITDTFGPLLLVALDDPETNIRVAAIKSLSCMSEADWLMLLVDSYQWEKTIDWRYVDAILRLCSKDRLANNANVRSAACKAIGDISTVCIGCRGDFIFADDSAIVFSQKVCNKIDSVLKADVPSVCSMGLFAMGNLALALKERYKGRDIPMSLLQQLFEESLTSVCTCLHSRDDKVVVNAIRSIGHLSYFAFSPGLSSRTQTKLDQYNNVVSILTRKVRNELDCFEQSPHQLSGKQRNIAKKHAWGSCNTLGMMLPLATNILPRLDSDCIKSAVLELFRCVKLSGAIHDKIIAAAVNSLAVLPPSFWEQLREQFDSISIGLESCLCYLFNVTNTTNSLPSYHHHIYTLTRTLLSCAESKDFRCLFSMNENLSFSFDFFYHWLVTNHVEVAVLKKLVGAVQDKTIQSNLDVSLVQMFLSRTIYQSGTQKTNDNRDLDVSAENDGCDEL